MIEAENRSAVATAKQSAYEIAYSAFISETDNMISDEGEITRIGNLGIAAAHILGLGVYSTFLVRFKIRTMFQRKIFNRFKMII